MDFFKTIQKRRSVRSYLSTPVPLDAINKILSAGRMAPSACNNQPWRFIVLMGGPEVHKLDNVYKRDWFLAAPAIIVVCIDREKAWARGDGKNYGDVDAAIAMDHMVLAATALDLGTCWIGAFDRVETQKALGLPDGIEPVVMTPVGYASGKVGPQSRKDEIEVVCWGSYCGG